MRRDSKRINIGPVPVGGDAPVVVQSMTCTDTRDVEATVQQVRELEAEGCEIVRVAVPDMEAANALSAIKERISIPLIADIHFDHRLALRALEAGVDGLRLNPGNIRDREKVKAVARAAKERAVPIRIGVNHGSVPRSLVEQGGDVDELMVQLAMDQIKLLEDLDFDLIKISLKAFDVPTTVEAYRRIAKLVPYPLHLGITEAGTAWAGTIRSTAGLAILLYEGIGDTIRVSLTEHPREEVRVAYEILKSLDLREHGPTMISCPTCGRVEVNLMDLAHRVEAELKKLAVPIKVAVMGCVVNGPGEARDADVGIAGGPGKGVIFRKGQVVRTVP